MEKLGPEVVEILQGSGNFAGFSIAAQFRCRSGRYFGGTQHAAQFAYHGPFDHTGGKTLWRGRGLGVADLLVAHKEVRETYLNTAAAADLRSRVSDEVSFGGINFRRYRGNAAFGVPVDKAFFYPEGVEGLFEIYYAPADTFETVNTLGLPLYARSIPDRDRDEWVRLEIESNPLPICTRPQVLRSARRT